jgi:hypothetical protein
MPFSDLVCEEIEALFCLMCLRNECILECHLKAGLSESRPASIATQRLANTRFRSNQQTQEPIATQRLASYAITLCVSNNWTRSRCNEVS